MNRSPLAQACLLLSLCVGCSPEPEAHEAVQKGRLDLSWLVPDGCDDAGVTDIDVVVGGKSVGTRSCDDGAWVARVPAGLQIIELVGLDRFGMPRYAAEAAVPVVEDDTVAVPTLILEALPAEIEVAWFFDNGRLCSTNDVVSVDAAAFEGGTRVAEGEADCDRGAALLRDLPAGAYLLDVVGRDADGRAVFHGELDVDVGKGEEMAVEVELTRM